MSIAALQKYVAANTKMVDAGIGQTAIEFFDVDYSDDIDAETLRALIGAVDEPVFGGAINFFDGTENNFMKVGGWIGDQSLALRLMAMGSHLGLWQLMTPSNMLPNGTDDELKKQMAGMGMVSIVAPNPKPKSTEQEG